MPSSFLVGASRSKNLGESEAKEALLLSGSREKTAENRERAISNRQPAILDGWRDISDRPPYFLEASRAAMNPERAADAPERAASDCRSHFLDSQLLAGKRQRAADGSSLSSVGSSLSSVDRGRAAHARSRPPDAPAAMAGEGSQAGNASLSATESRGRAMRSSRSRLLPLYGDMSFLSSFGRVAIPPDGLRGAHKTHVSSCTYRHVGQNGALRPISCVDRAPMSQRQIVGQIRAGLEA